jgi:tRNA A-37 threonylcarbamoyl transferase component Bud32
MNQDQSIKSLSGGLSGCKLILSSDGKSVTKISSDNSYNSRLVNQIKKQIEFKDILVEGMECPDVIESGINPDGLEYFTMKYVTGKDYKNFLSYSSPEEIRLFTDSIFRYIKEVSCSKRKYTTEEFSEACVNKLRSISSHIPDHDFCQFIESKIEGLGRIEIPMSFCHGDLTLSNILFSKKTIFLLDFLDSYIESWVIDLVKLKQDLFYFWSILRDNHDQPNLRFIQASIKIWGSIEKEYPHIVHSEEFKILEALNFLRIYPYAKEQKDILTIEKILKKLPLYEEFNNPNGR